MELVNKGHKVYEFPNGDRIDCTFNKEIYSGVFMGSLRSEATESIVFHDKKNDLKAEIVFGKMKKKYLFMLFLDLLIFLKVLLQKMENLSVNSMAHIVDF